MLLGILGIILSLVTLITLAYRGMPVILAAPIASVVALLFSGAPILPAYTEVFMPAMANYVGSYFPLFLTGAIFGLLMTVTGFAESIARSVTGWIGTRSAMAATVITSALMTYGGISLFVVAFVIYPIARELFRVGDIPRRLIPGTIALGIFTFTMTALPGSPQVQNIIPGQFFDTGPYAAPVVGTVGALMIFGLGMAWLETRRRRLVAAGESFSDARNDTPAGHASAGGDIGVEARMQPTGRVLPFLPLLTVIGVNFLCTLVIFPAMDWSFLQQETYGGIAYSSRAGIWAVTTAITVAILLIIALHLKRFEDLKQAMYEGTRQSMLPIFSVGSEVGYGAVVASVAAFAVIRDGVMNLGTNALTTSVIATSATAGITGSSSGGMTIALNALGPQLRQMAEAEGTSLEIMHRLTAMAAGGIDTLPHSGAVVTLLIVCGLTHRQSYKDVFAVTLAIPVLVVAALVAAVSLMGLA